MEQPPAIPLEVRIRDMFNVKGQRQVKKQPHLFLVWIIKYSIGM